MSAITSLRDGNSVSTIAWNPRRKPRLRIEAIACGDAHDPSLRGGIPEQRVAGRRSDAASWT
jgi:hypothetical protein